MYYLVFSAFPEARRDFSTTPVTITFPSDKGDGIIPLGTDEIPGSVSIPIVNDKVNERLEMFFVVLQLVEAEFPTRVFLTQLNTSFCVIEDNDRKLIQVCGSMWLLRLLIYYNSITSPPKATV